MERTSDSVEGWWRAEMGVEERRETSSTNGVVKEGRR
jgi:hypothetical protein